MYSKDNNSSDSQSYKTNNKRIVKNASALYLRTFLTLIIGLYSSRLLLKELGISDFGIYNIVAGVAVLFTFVNSAMTQASQRFLNFSMSNEKNFNVSEVFSTGLYIHLLLGVIIFVLAETIGLYIVNFVLKIPENRMFAANMAYQFIILLTFFSILGTPFIALIIANEKLQFFAYSTLGQSIAKFLAIIAIGMTTSYDRLILYSFSVCFVTIFFQFLNASYCLTYLENVSLKLKRNYSLFKDMLHFFGWSFFGAVASISKEQGVNIILNTFVGVLANAAIGIAVQVSGSAYQFVQSLQMAFNPQITKYYAGNDFNKFISLIFNSSKYSFFLVWAISLPLLSSADYVLTLWLGTPPEISADFVRIAIIYIIFDALSGPLWVSVQATGKIRNYQILVSIIIMATLPMAFLLLKLGYSCELAYASKVVVNGLCYIWRIFYIKRLFGFPSFRYIKEVLFRVVLVSIISSILPLFLIEQNPVSTFFQFIQLCTVAELGVVVSILVFGMNNFEREYLKEYVLKIFSRKNSIKEK